MGKHSRFSPSSSKRYLNCPPSLTLEEQFEDEDSVYAAEGSAAHALAEHFIKKHLKKRSKRPTSEFDSDEMDEAVGEYVSFVIEQIELAKHAYEAPIFYVEQKVDISAYVPECLGTSDMVIITDKMVHIIDLKYGKGVLVEAENNTQMMIYGLGILLMAELLFDIETVQMTIHQPRLQSVTTWEINAQELKTWAEDELKPKALLALNGEGEFAVGDWCRFCKARNTCRTRAESFLEMAKYEFKLPALLTDDEISEVLKVADDLAKWAADVYAFATDEAITHGKDWVGFKLVEGRSNRKYSSDEEVAEAAVKAGYSDIYRKTLIGISEMEKLMGKKQFNEILGTFVYKPQGKITLVPESDKREPINTVTAEAEFKEE